MPPPSYSPLSSQDSFLSWGGTVIPPRLILIRDGIVGDGGTSGQGDRSRFVNDSIGWERGVWGMYIV